MKGDIVLNVLRHIGEIGIGVFELSEAILDAGYGASAGQIDRKMRENRKRREAEAAEFMAKRNHYVLMSRLKKQGLILEKKEGGKRRLFLTFKGKTKLTELKKKKAEELPGAEYEAGESNNFTIIAFDIPEKERKKRSWLRAVLKNLGLAMLQKSVWIGKVKIPAEFIDDLADLKLLDFVEVLQITKTGSLKRLG